MSSVLAKLVGNSEETQQQLSTINQTVNKIYSAQVSAADDARKAEQRRAQDEKRKSADSPLKSILGKQEAASKDSGDGEKINRDFHRDQGAKSRRFEHKKTRRV